MIAMAKRNGHEKGADREYLEENVGDFVNEDIGSRKRSAAAGFVMQQPLQNDTHALLSVVQRLVNGAGDWVNVSAKFSFDAEERVAVILGN